MKSGKNIDEIFQKVFEAETFSYKDEYWKDAQSALASQNGKKFGLTGLINGSKILGISIAASVVFAAMLPFAITSSKDEQAMTLTQVDNQLGHEQSFADKTSDASFINGSKADDNLKGLSGENENTQSYASQSSENTDGSNGTLGTMDSENAGKISQNNSYGESNNLSSSNPLAMTNDGSSEVPNSLKENENKNGNILLTHIEPNGGKTQWASREADQSSDNKDLREIEEYNSSQKLGGLALGKTGDLTIPGSDTHNLGSEGKTGNYEASTSTTALASSSIQTSSGPEGSDETKDPSSLAALGKSETDENSRSKSHLSLNIEDAATSSNEILKKENSMSFNTPLMPLTILDWEKGLLLQSGLTLVQMPLLDVPNENKFPTPITHKPVWTLGLETNYNMFAKNLAESSTTPYLTERANGETLQNSFGYGLRLARTTRSFTTQIGLQYGGLNENISYTSTDTIVKREFIGVRYVSRMEVEGGTVSRGEAVYDTIILDTTYAEIENHTRNTVRFLEVPLYVGKRFSYKKLGFDFGVGASWQRVIGQSGYVINSELDGLTSLDGFLSKNAFNGMAGLNADYQFAKGWRVGVSARYKVPIGALRFDSDFRLQQYNYGFSISREIF